MQLELEPRSAQHRTAARVGLVISSGEDQEASAVIQATPGLRLAAVAGCPRGAAPPHTTWHDDPRSLVTQAEIDLLASTGSPRIGAELTPLALARGVNVWRVAPAAPDLAAAVQLFARAAHGPGRLLVTSPWSLQAPLVAAAGAAQQGRWVYSDLEVAAAGAPLDSWRSSLRDVCGGVLATDGYAALEQLVALRGMPESVILLTGRCRPVEGLAPRETEDVAVALLRYAGGGIATIRATWDLGPWRAVMCHHAPGGTIRLPVDANAEDPGEAVEPGVVRIPRGDLAAQAAVVSGWLERPHAPRPGEVERHLAVMAILEAGYLSVRTRQPESPLGLLNLQAGQNVRRERAT